MDLDAVVADLAGPAGGEKLQLGGFHGDALTLVLHLAGIPDHEVGGTDLGCHIGKLEADSLVLVDGLAEGGALFGILDGLFHGMLHKAACDGADGHTGSVESLHRDHEASALGTDTVFGRNVNVVKAEFAGAGAAHAHLLLKLADGEAFGILRNNKNGDALVSGFRIGLGHDQVIIRNTGVGDPGLAAVENVAAVRLLLGDRLDGACVRTRVGFGQTEGKDLSFGNQRKIFGLLLIGAVIQNHVGCQPVSIQEQGDGSAALCDLVDDDLAGDGVTATAAVLLGEMNGHKAGVNQLRNQIEVKSVFIHVAIPRLYLVGGKLFDHITDHKLLFGKLEHL